VGWLFSTAGWWFSATGGAWGERLISSRAATILSWSQNRERQGL
jgi:hypothetical protein